MQTLHLGGGGGRPRGSLRNVLHDRPLCLPAQTRWVPVSKGMLQSRSAQKTHTTAEGPDREAQPLRRPQPKHQWSGCSGRGWLVACDPPTRPATRAARRRGQQIKDLDPGRRVVGETMTTHHCVAAAVPQSECHPVSWPNNRCRFSQFLATRLRGAGSGQLHRATRHAPFEAISHQKQTTLSSIVK